MTGTEYGLMVEWEDGTTEVVPATSPDHAAEMARKLYAGRSCWTVGREVNPWRYVRTMDAVLTGTVAR
jgi:hypothetical protein